ncbi:MAG: PAS domain-containing protein [Desulfuromonadaceae bacterium]|nr:PAS domain-containing protein [Desulfuromonadaceae bacterium]MDD2856089.1 PAS domain-containing protein [Desulfuromonadaceae bacterium]
MSDTVTIPAGKLTYLEERAKKLAREKAYLQLIMQLLIKIGSVKGVENTIEAFLGNILNVIGGTNIILYYRIDNTLHYADVMGVRTLLAAIDDELVQTVMTTHEPIELEHDFIESRMLTPEFSKAYTWVCPLMADADVVGVLKMENVSIAMRDINQGLTPVFNFIALKLNSEIQGYAELKQAYEDLSNANIELEEEIYERTLAEEELSKAHDELEQRVEERTAELHKSEQFHRTVLQTTMEGFWLLAADMRILTVNDAYCQMSGYSNQELCGLHIKELEAKEDEEKIVDHARQIAEFGKVRFESQHRRKDRSIFHVAVSVTHLPLEGGQFAVFVNDITEIKQSEIQLKSLNERLQLATSSAHLGIWDWNVRDNILVWDDRMLALFGITRETFPNSADGWLNALHPEDRETAIAECQAALNGEKEFDTDFRILHPDGTVKHVRGKALVLRGADGTAERMIGVNYDVTDAKNAADEKKKLEDQLQQAQKMESVGRLAGGVAHDFNNMLSVILGHAELGLMHLEPTHRVCADLKEISKTAERSADLTRQLLAFARKQTVSPKVIDLNETITTMLKMLQRLIGEDITLTWQPAFDLWQVRMDPSQIDQIMANLCVNARDAIEGNGRITIETANRTIDADYCDNNPEAAPGEYVCLSVSDSGCGMDKETQTHIFEPFFTTKELGKGTGLGLATVYGAVKQNNGFINIYSEPGQGTTFTIYLPHDESGRERQSASGAGATTVPRGQETILLVEDEPAILNIASMMLEKQGYTVLQADTPGEAIRLAREHIGDIQLLMTDVIMPEMNGRELAKNVLSIYPRMKRLFMSGYTADVIATHGMLEEGVHFIQKPFSLPNMAAKVREVLDN